MRYASTLLATASLTTACFAAPAVATAAVQEPSQVEQLQAELEALRASEKAARDRLESVEQRLRTLENSAGVAGAVPVPDSSQALMRGRGLATQETPPQGTAVLGSVDEPERKSPAPTEAVEAVARAQQNSYGSHFSFEPGLSYSHFTNARVNLSGFLALDAIFLGLISVDEVESDVLTTDWTARYGFNDRFQIDANIPYLRRKSTFKSGGAGGDASALAEESVKTNGLGDISFGASYRVLDETARLPDIVVNARVKAPTGKHPFGIEFLDVPGTEGNLQVPDRLSTGTGVWAAAAGISLLKTIDPLVIFGSLAYFHNFGADFDDIDETDGDQPGRAKVGNSIQYGAGIAFALNDTTSLSFSFTQRFVRETRVRLDEDGIWQDIIGSDANVGILNIGATFGLTDRLVLLTNLSTGITDDAPDMSFNLRLPYRF